MKDATEVEQQGVAYGSLYYERGERLEKAKEQILEVAKQKPIGWFFDIIHTKNQAPMMDGLRLQIIGIIKATDPKMSDDNIFVLPSVKSKRKARPAMALMQSFFRTAQKARADREAAEKK